jgi:hypothetical protein
VRAFALFKHLNLSEQAGADFMQPLSAVIYEQIGVKYKCKITAHYDFLVLIIDPCQIFFLLRFLDENMSTILPRRNTCPKTFLPK